MAVWPLQRNCNEFYGDPRTASGRASARWENANLVIVPAPWKMYFDGKLVEGARVHKKCAESLARVFADIWNRCGRSQAEIDRIGMSKYAGGYYFRTMRGGKSLSMHAYGCAVDFDPERNGLGNKNPQMDRRVIEAFEAEGWEWGGHWSRTDGMHFQAARTRANPKTLPKAKATTSRAKKATPASELTSEQVEAVQDRLHRLGYHEVGWVDGEIGDRTRDATAAFQRNEGLPVTGELDSETIARLGKAHPRKIAERRENVSARDLRNTYTPVRQTFLVKVWSAILAVLSGIWAGIMAVIEFFGEATYQLDPLKEFFSDVPMWAWFAMALGIAIAMYRNGDQAERSITNQVRRGEAAGWSDE